MVKHTPMAPAVRPVLPAVRMRSAGAGLSETPVAEVALSPGCHACDARAVRGRRLSNRVIRHRARAALRVWRDMW